jgi:hypothetical protein
MLKWMLHKQDLWACPGLIWMRTGTSDRPVNVVIIDSHKMQGIYLLAQEEIMD